MTLNAASYNGARSPSARVLLDCGAQFSYLPLDYTQTIFKKLGAELSPEGRPYVDCGLAASSKIFDFEFGSGDKILTIRVPLANLVYHDADKIPLKSQAGVELCLLALTFDDDEHLALGDSFLRSTYVVFHLTHNEISIAQAKYSTVSKIVEIPGAGVAAMGL